ncbi:hypothetical protein OG385_36205 [Streptomyces sp. NBC_01306]|nr:hypothetical protein [Streptomyces sp. NBC_01306]
MHIRGPDPATTTAAARSAGGTVTSLSPVPGRTDHHAFIRDPAGALFAVTDLRGPLPS